MLQTVENDQKVADTHPASAKQKKQKVVSMFSGCGGMDLGFMGGFEFLGKRYARNPFEITWANDLNPAACRTYKENLKHTSARSRVSTTA